MSAFVVNAAHIATCAKVIFETVFKHERDRPDEKAIRADLALANIASVAWRYGPDGEAAYAPMLGMIAEQLKGAGYGAAQVTGPSPSTEDIDKACFCEGYTWQQFLKDCESADSVKYSPAEAFQYLSCLNYQSCELPDWKTSKVCEWIRDAQMDLADEMVEKQLDGRHVWVVEEEAIA